MANRRVGTTYLPLNLAVDTPPEWFLQQLFDYDADLVLFPSSVRLFAYVVSRRRRMGRWSVVERNTITNPDTQVCMNHNLIPVCLMFKTGPVWNVDNVLQRLKARDMWAHGGADKVADFLDAQDAQEQADRDKAVRDDLWNRSGDAWRSYQARTGQRVINSGPSRSGAATIPTVPSSSTATGGVILAS